MQSLKETIRPASKASNKIVEFDFINVDEACYVTREAAIKTVRGRLLGFNTYTGRPREGIFWQVSSPKPVGHVMERWKRGDPQFTMADPRKYLSLRATIWDNPLLDQEAIADIMADYTDAMIRQELMAEFLENTDAVFPYQMVMSCCDDNRYEVRALYDQIRFWKARHQGEKSIRTEAGLTDDITHYECEPIIGHRYVSSWDLGKKPTSKGRNATVAMVWDVTHEPWTLAAYLYRDGMGYIEAKNQIEQWHLKYSSNGTTCQTVIDATGKGDVLQEFMEQERTIDKLEGIVYSSANKPNMIHAGKIAIEKGLPAFPFIRRMVDQLTQYELNDKDLAQDIVMCFCQAMYSARSLTKISERAPSQRLLNSMYQYNHRTPQARLLNPRFVESRLARRAGRMGGTQVNRRARRSG